MPNRTLLIPGPKATSLVDAGGTLVYDATHVGIGLQSEDLSGRSPAEWRTLLGVEHTPGEWAPARTSLEPGCSLTPGAVARAPYEQLWPYVEPWPYDWRLDLRWSAQLLLRWLEANKPAGGRWNLIGHSQGGLLIVLASQLTTQVDAFARLVERVVLIGAPLAGTMRAAEALLWGGEGMTKAEAAAARAVARSWPSLHQMLPSWRAVRRENGEAWPYDRQLTEIGGWSGPTGAGLREDLLLRARETQPLLQGPFSRFGPEVETLAFQGQRQKTPVSIVRRGSSYPKDRAMKSEAGDGVVPSKKTLEWGGGPFSNQVALLIGKPRPHRELCEDEDVVGLTMEFLEASGGDDELRGLV